MKNRLILSILNFLILFLCSKSNLVSTNLFEIEYLEEEGAGKLQKFLANVTSNGNPITIQDCKTCSKFEIKKKILNPPELTIGQNVYFKVIGLMKEDTLVNKLHISTILDGEEIFSVDVAKGEIVKKGL